MDKIDHQILDELRRNARIPVTQLSEKTGRSRTAVQARIDKMEHQEKILGYTIREASVHSDRAIGSIILVSLSVRKESEAFMDTARSIPEVISCHGVAGDPAFALILARVNEQRMKEIVEKIYETEGVSKTETILSMFQVF